MSQPRLPLALTLICWCIVAACFGEARSQFNDAKKRSPYDTTAIKAFLRSYEIEQETLYAKSFAAQYLGPLSSFSERRFLSSDGASMPVDSADALVTLHTGNITGLRFGAVTTSSLGLVLTILIATNTIKTNGLPSWLHSGTALLLVPVETLVGSIVGYGIGSLFHEETIVAPMNAFGNRDLHRGDP